MDAHGYKPMMRKKLSGKGEGTGGAGGGHDAVFEGLAQRFEGLSAVFG